jgi:hypothetical protein
MRESMRTIFEAIYDGAHGSHVLCVLVVRKVM